MRNERWICGRAFCLAICYLATATGSGFSVPPASQAAQPKHDKAKPNYLSNSWRLRLTTKKYRNGVPISSIAISPDSRWLVVGGKDGIIRVWDLRTHKLAASWKAGNRDINTLAFSSKGDLLLASEAYDWRYKTGTWVWSWPSHQLLWTHAGKSHSSAALSPDGSIVAVGETVRYHREPYYRMWDASGAWNERARSVRLSPAKARGGGVTLYRLSTGKAICTLHTRNSPFSAPWDFHPANMISNIQFSPDGRMLTGNADWYGRCGDYLLLQAWNVRSGQLLRFPENQSKFISDQESEDDDENDREFVSHLTYPHGKQVIAATAINSVIVWNAQTGRRIRRTPFHGMLSSPLGFSPDGEVIAFAVRKTIALARAKDLTIIQSLPIKSAFIISFAISPDGNSLAVGSYDGWLEMWYLDRPDTPAKPIKPQLSETGNQSSARRTSSRHTSSEKRPPVYSRTASSTALPISYGVPDSAARCAVSSSLAYPKKPRP